jgi:hypothetical protein
MTTPFVEERPHRVETATDRRALEMAGAGATAEAIGAAAAIVLAILGLTGILPDAMMAIAAIVLGVAVLLDAGTVGARYSRLMHEAAEGHRLVRAQVGGGISAGTVAGVAGIVLGILALLGLEPMLLCSIALIAFGAALLFGSASKSRFASFGTTHHGMAEPSHRAIDEAIRFSAGGEMLIGVGAIVLGILALLGTEPMTLVLVGFLGVGAAVMLSGSALGARAFGILRHAA